MISAILLIANLVLLFIILYFVLNPNKKQDDDLKVFLNKIPSTIERIEPTLKDEFKRNREEAQEHARHSREELFVSFKNLSDTTIASLKNNEEKISNLTETIDNKITTLQNGLLNSSKENRKELNDSLKSFSDRFSDNVKEFNALQKEKFNELTNAEEKLRNETNKKLDEIRQSVEKKLASIQEDNTKKLEEMRITVDEKLHTTLEKRLGESFKLVSERLEQVHKGLGEMQTLVVGVGDLKKVLTNIKTRGTWGEIQLEALVDQILTPEQYEKNVLTKPNSSARVEFAIRLPGRDDSGSPVWLPIDAKFPMEDYQRLIEAQELADIPAIDAAGKALETRIKNEAKLIRDKYIEPPHTTDFAILYLPTEGLYAEVLRRPGLSDYVQRASRVNIAGPTTLAAMLNSLQMGFQTLAIEKRSSEVWTLLGAVKTEFGKFGTALSHTKKKLQEATNSIDDTEKRNRVLTRKLSTIDAMPEVEASKLLDIPNNNDADTKTTEKEEV